MILDDRYDRLTRKLSIIAPEGPPLAQICHGGATLLGVTGVAVVLMTQAEPAAVVASYGIRSDQLERLHLELGDGPGFDAFQVGGPIVAADLSDGARDRWPAFADRATADGARAAFVFPLQLGALRLGVLYLTRDRTGPLSAEQLADAIDLADMAMLAVLDIQTGAASGKLGAGLDGNWTHRAAVHQATGMVSAQLGTDLVDALARIRAHAFAAGRSIYEVAGDITSGQLRLEP